ncbi:MAG TPA: phosphotransferase family protein [Solirubrobacterales bacterium]|nr:phosphotransferase family protein [Solirubrobacterales bacterium]
MTSEVAAPPDAQAVRELLEGALGTDPGPVTLSSVEGGASRETFLVDAGERRFVIRRDPQAGMSFTPLQLECEVIGRAREAGVPVAPPLAFEPAGGRLGGAGYVMPFVEGTSVAPRILRRDEYAGAREMLPSQLGDALARIHAVNPGRIEGLAGGEHDPALEACELWERELDEIGEPLPAVEAGLRWLRLHPPPPPERVALVHGDFRLGNLIVDDEGLAAVIDWELCHAGDPAEDIGWLTIRSWRFGNDHLPVAGLGALGPFLAAYESAGGTRPDAERLRWWEAMGNVKWAVICARQAHDHLTGARPSAELASLGRRICEPEWDLLELLG